MGRIIVKTAVAGWYIDSENPDGNRVRQKPGDTIITREQFAAAKESPNEERAVETKSTPVASTEAKPQPEKHVPTVLSDTGKLLVGKTTTINCKFKDDEGKVCGAERVVKPQDAWQVKHCVPHQIEHRRRIKREKLRAKRKRERAASQKTKPAAKSSK